MSATDGARAGRPLVLHVATVPQSFRFLRGQLAFMRVHGFDVALVASAGWEADETRERERVDVYAVAMPRRITPLADLRAVAQLVLLMRRLRPAIVHAHTPKGGLLGMIAATIARVPVRIYHMRGLPLESATGVRRVLLRLSERTACHLAGDVICVSASLRASARDAGVLGPEQGVVLAGGSGNGIDASRTFAPRPSDVDISRDTRAALEIPADALVVTFIGRVVVDKGIRELAAAWREVRSAHPEAVLVIGGPVEDTDPVPAATLAALRSDPSVRMTGHVSDVRSLLVASDLVVLPTYREGLPNVLLEAAAMQRPVVATRVTGCVDAVADGTTGTLVPPRDEGALASAIRRYLGSAALRAAHGAAGRAWVLDQFSQERIWSSLEALYRASLSRVTSPSSAVPTPYCEDVR